MFNFDRAVSREESNAEKYVLREQLFGTNDVLPAWVADMDIPTPACVLEAVKKRLEHPIIGYEEVPHRAFEAQKQWFLRRYGVEYSTQDMLYSHSVVSSMGVAIEALTQEGDGVIVQIPVYPPFFHSVHKYKRTLLTNPLVRDESGRYGIDFEDLEKKMSQGAKLLLLCSPHNPVGRAWNQEELEKILALCCTYGVYVFADEIHCDLVYPPHKHIPFFSLGEDACTLGISAIGVGKTFNMAGFAMSSVVIPNESVKKAFLQVYEKIHFAQGSVLSHVAFEAAYTEAQEWLEALKKHLYHNFTRLDALCKKYDSLLRVTPIEATYLAWLDCRGLGLKDKALREFFIQEAGLGLNPGIAFSREGSGYMRLNFAVSSATMTEILTRLEKALEKRLQQRKESGTD